MKKLKRMTGIALTFLAMNQGLSLSANARNPDAEPMLPSGVPPAYGNYPSTIDIDRSQRQEQDSTNSSWGLGLFVVLAIAFYAMRSSHRRHLPR